MPVNKGQLNKRLLVGIVLDRSSSMHSVLAETISGTNEQFSALRDSDDAENTLVAFFSFNQQVTPVFKNDDGLPALVPCSDLVDISEADYFPSGMTAMYDGVGDAIDFFANEAKKNDDVLIVIISDGEENASNRFTSEQIAGRVKELQDSGWNFTYIGANQDLTQVQADLGIHAGNMLAYDASSVGTVQMSGTLSNAVRSYTSARASHIASGSTVRCATQNLYDHARADDDNAKAKADVVTITTTGNNVSGDSITVGDVTDESSDA